MRITIEMEEMDMGLLRAAVDTISDNRNMINLRKNIKVYVESEDVMTVAQHGTSFTTGKI